MFNKENKFHCIGKEMKLHVIDTETIKESLENEYPVSKRFSELIKHLAEQKMIDDETLLLSNSLEVINMVKSLMKDGLDLRHLIIYFTDNQIKKDYFDERFNLDDNYIIGLVTSTFIQHENKIGE